MKKKNIRTKKKGFTLMELVAVIIVLALISLISLPIITNSISNTNKTAFRSSADSVLKSINNEIANEGYKLPAIYEISEIGIKRVESENTSEIEHSGGIDFTGYAYINANESSSICVCNDKYCAKKSYIDKDITVSKKTDINNCNDNDGTLPIIDLSMITSDNTVEINHEFTIEVPTIYDTEGEEIKVLYKVKNSSNSEIGNEETMSVIGSQFTTVYNDTILVEFTVTDKTTNQTASKTKTIRVVDTKGPTVIALVSSTNASYQVLNVNLNINATDETNMQMYVSQTGYETGGEWETYNSSKPITLTGTLDGVSRTIYLTVRDEAGNKTEKQLTYTPYKECSQKTSNTTEGTCTSSCTKSSTITYTDRYTGKSCGTASGGSTSCTGGDCYSGGSSGGSSSGRGCGATTCGCCAYGSSYTRCYNNLNGQRKQCYTFRDCTQSCNCHQDC